MKGEYYIQPKQKGTTLLSINSTILDIVREHINNNRSMTSISQEMGVSNLDLTSVLK